MFFYSFELTSERFDFGTVRRTVTKLDRSIGTSVVKIV